MKKIWLIGTGPMAIDYVKVLKELHVDPVVIGRGEHSAASFTRETGVTPFTGGLEKFLKTDPVLPDAVINAVGIDNLSDSTIRLMDYGVKYILLEKPGVAYPREMETLVAKAHATSSQVLLAYNRRFYASVLKAREIIKQDGGVSSINFEFTEWSHVIRGLKKPVAEHHNWFLGNSTHIIDTAFYLAGNPKSISCYVKGGIDWHPKSSVFAGAGETETGALFSYHANWEAPGRWVIEVLTNKHRLIFKPIESLQIQEIGSVAVNPVQIDDSLDKRFKPGLYLQTKAFIDKKTDSICTIDDQNSAMKYYVKMSGY